MMYMLWNGFCMIWEIHLSIFKIQIFLGPKICFDLTRFWTQNLFGHKLIWIRNVFISEMFLDPRMIWTNFFFYQNSFWNDFFSIKTFSERSFLQTIFYKFFKPKISLNSIIYRIPKFWTLNLFDPRIILGPKELKYWSLYLMISWIKTLLDLKLVNFKGIE